MCHISCHILLKSGLETLHDLFVKFLLFGGYDMLIYTIKSFSAVPSAALHDIKIRNTHRMENRGRVMPLRYNYDKPEKPRISRVFGYQARFFILFQPEKSSREVVIS